MQGRVIHSWSLAYEAAGHADLLANGHLLCSAKQPGNPYAQIEGAAGLIIEADWQGATLAAFQNAALHHNFSRLKNGNTLVLTWVDLPSAFANRVAGGDPGSEIGGVMLGERIQEIRPNGKVAWEWVAHEHLQPDTLPRCPLCPRDTWLHANACVGLADGNIMVSFAKTNTVAIINRATGTLNWHWGSTGELAHQHAPTMLHNGNILIYDNGYHPNGLAQNYSRLLEVDPRTNKMVWSYEGPDGGTLRMLFYSAMYSNCQRLPNGNTLACEGMTGRIFEVTSSGDLVWEYVNDEPPLIVAAPAQSYPLYEANRYDMDHPGLRTAPFTQSPARASRLTTQAATNAP
jgi:hypothetical protein